MLPTSLSRGLCRPRCCVDAHPLARLHTGVAGRQGEETKGDLRRLQRLARGRKSSSG